MFFDSQTVVPLNTKIHLQERMLKLLKSTNVFQKFQAMYCIRKHTQVFKNDRPGACLTKYYGLIWAESLIWVTKMAIRDGMKAIALKNQLIIWRRLESLYN